MNYFAEIALRNAALGHHVLPCVPNDKKPLTAHGWQDASADEKQIQKWADKWPDANVGIACGPSHLVVLDIDHGLSSEADLLAWMERNKIPNTYTVRTGRRPEFGAQLYYSGEMRGFDFILDGCTGQIRGAGQYVMAAGCVHPSGETYQVLFDEPVQPLPDVIRNIQAFRLPIKDGPMEKIPEGAGRHAALTSIAGKLRNSGLDKDALHVALLPINESICEVPVADEDVLHIAESVGRYAVPEPTGEIIIGRPKEPEPVEIAEKHARPVFPDSAWQGTIFGAFADIVCTGNYIRKRLASECFRAITGAIAGDQVTCGIAGVRLREYHAIIASPQSGKSYALNLAIDFYGRPTCRNAFVPLLMLGGGDNSYRLSGIGAQRFLPGSSNSFVDELTRDDKKKIKKGEDVNVTVGPLWRPTARLITLQGEAMALFARLCSPDWTGQALSALVTDLYDSLDAEVAITADRSSPKIPVQLQYSMVLCTQPQIWRRHMAGHMMDSGLFGRFYIVGSEYKPKKVALPDYDAELLEEHFGALRRDVFARLVYLKEQPLRITIVPPAKVRLEEWENSLPEEDDLGRDLSSRMGLHAWRAAMARAWGWIPQRTEITLEDANAAIELGEYQVKMRQYYAPTVGDSPRWKHLNAVKAAIEQAGQISIRELRRKVHGNNFPEDFDWALAYLGQRRQVVVNKEGRSQVACWVIGN